MNFKSHIRGIPDFPKPGILFYDISPLLADPQAWRGAVGAVAETVRTYQPDLLIGIESRGFLLAAPLAAELNTGFAMVRKRGKLPGDTVEYSYDLEYGSDTIELQADAVKPGQRVVVLDDLLATGGTMAATVNLVRRMGGEVAGAAFLIELTFLGGREKLDVPVSSLMSYDT
jgi:adenine phosphoribosyltransferase